ncbi:TPA: Hpt domain-containing protein [Clostridioides difficile]|nr:Hpt domain-containing protein [Clostridioides difficile]
MNLSDCYIIFGGNYDEVLCRLQHEHIVQKFIFKFLDDKSFNLLKVSIDNENYDDALRFTHTLKGICQNLSFSRLYESSNQITIELKDGNYKKAVDMIPQLSKDYYKTIDIIKEYKMSKEK